MKHLMENYNGAFASLLVAIGIQGFLCNIHAHVDDLYECISFLLTNLAMVSYMGSLFHIKKIRQHEEALSLHEDNKSGEHNQTIHNQDFLYAFAFALLNVCILALRMKTWQYTLESIFVFLNDAIVNCLNIIIVYRGVFRRLDLNVSILLYLILFTASGIFTKVLCKGVEQSEYDLLGTPFVTFNIPMALIIYEISQDTRFPLNPYHHTRVWEEEDDAVYGSQRIGLGCFLLLSKCVKQLVYHCPHYLYVGYEWLVFSVILSLECTSTLLLVVFQIQE